MESQTTDNQEKGKKKKQFYESSRLRYLFHICNLSETFTYLFTGSNAMALGFSRSSVMSVFLLLPSVVATEIVFKMLSVQ